MWLIFTYYLLNISLHSFGHKSINIASIALIFLKHILVVLVSNLPSLEPYLRGLYLVLKLHYCIIYTYSKNLYINSIHIIGHIFVNTRRIEVVFVEKLSTGRAYFELAIFGTTSLPLVSRFKATLVSNLHRPQELIYSSHPHHWLYLYQYKADWSYLWLKNYPLVLSVSNVSSLELYPRRLYRVLKLSYDKDGSKQERTKTSF